MTAEKCARVLVLLAAYNGQDYIEEQLDSILSQKGVHVDIIISLDSSTDLTLEIIQQYINKNANITLLPYGSKFGSAGRNFFNLIKKVKLEDYDYYAFADQDDIWLENKLKSAVELMALTSSDGYSSNVTAFWVNGRKTLVKKNHPQTEYDFLFESPGPGCTFVMSNVLFKAIKEAVDKKYTSIDKVWLHDWFCYSLARSSGFKWVIDGNSYMLYRQHGLNEVGANSGFKAFKERFKVMIKGEGLVQVITQAEFLEQTGCRPIKYLNSGRLGAFKLALNAHKLRRKTTHKLFCFLFFILLVIIGNRRAGEGV